MVSFAFHRSLCHWHRYRCRTFTLPRIQKVNALVTLDVCRLSRCWSVGGEIQITGQPNEADRPTGRGRAKILHVFLLPLATLSLAPLVAFFLLLLFIFCSAGWLTGLTGHQMACMCRRSFLSYIKRLICFGKALFVVVFCCFCTHSSVPRSLPLRCFGQRKLGYLTLFNAN